MENLRPINHLDILKRDWRKVLIVTLVIILIALVVSLIQPFLYRASVSVLVVQKSSFSIDAYSASKSEERIANKLAQVVQSSSFREAVFESGFDIDKTYFPTDELKLRKKWSQTVQPEVVAGLSKLKISIYHQDPNQALQLSQAVAFTLTTEKQTYIGIEDVDLKVIDTPLVSKYPVKPNVLVNIFLGLILGLILGVAYVILTYRPERDRLMQMQSAQRVTPHLIEEQGSKREEMDRPTQAGDDDVEIPEITDLEEVEEQASEQASPEGEPLGQGNKREEMNDEEELAVPEVKMPDDEVEIDQHDEEIKEVEEEVKPEYKDFTDEDQIVGMPNSK